MRSFVALGKLFSRIMRDERGSEPLECAFILGCLGTGGYYAVERVGGKVQNLWGQLDAALGAIR